MPKYDYDLFIIGAGSGGVRAAASRRTSARGSPWRRNAVIGGTCVNVGCVPKKLLRLRLAISRTTSRMRPASAGPSARARFDWPTLIANKNKEIERLNGIYERLLHASRRRDLQGARPLVDPHTVEVGGKTVTAENILVATGGWPVVPDIPGKEHAITSNEVFYLEKLPEKILIVGGGYIAVEFAGIFNGLGVEVTQLYRGPVFLRGFDDDVRALPRRRDAQEGHRPALQPQPGLRSSKPPASCAGSSTAGSNARSTR